MKKHVIWLNEDKQSQKQKEHKATVVPQSDGTLQFEVQTIITPKGLAKDNKLVSIIPKNDEQVLKLSETPYLFQELRQMNLILTNACNLSCSYCYEQHNKDFGRFTNDSLLSAYRFLVNSNSRQKKIFQFFGGEPLIHKDIILDFLKKNEDELRENARGDINTSIGIVTNGLLVSEEIVNEYFKYDFTSMLISLDTDIAEVDHREIGQDKIDKLMQRIADMPADIKVAKRVLIRCTLARENAPSFKQFVDNLCDRGIRKMVVHPLILDSSKGFIKWSDNEWNTLHQDILYVLDKYEDLEIHFSEGVGQKGEENCMIGSEMIAIDGSGDFSGCYFFTNQKAGPGGSAILGNVFQDTIYVDRYTTFRNEYNKMFETEEQCQTCDYKNACYQCPAGNLDIGAKMFSPDDMCQKIVKLYLDLQEDVIKKQTKKKFESIVKTAMDMGENASFIRGLNYLMFFNYFNYHPKTALVHDGIDHIDYRHLLALWKKIILKDIVPKFNAESYTEQVKALLNDDKMEIDDFYYFVMEKSKMLPSVNQRKASNMVERCFYLTLLHITVLQNTKSFHGTFSERLAD
jgi:uncharacterized protein